MNGRFLKGDRYEEPYMEITLEVFPSKDFYPLNDYNFVDLTPKSVIRMMETQLSFYRNVVIQTRYPYVLDWCRAIVAEHQAKMKLEVCNPNTKEVVEVQVLPNGEIHDWESLEQFDVADNLLTRIFGV